MRPSDAKTSGEHRVSTPPPNPVVTRRTIVVTGVGRRGQVGEVVARVFAASGDQVCIVARQQADAEARAGEITATLAADPVASAASAHGRIIPFAADLASPAATERLARDIVAATGRVDALVNLAGGFAADGPVAAADPALLDSQFQINVGTAYCATRAFLPALRTAHGAIVFVASASALPRARVAGTAAYAIAKSGVVTLMRAVADEERATGVRANAVAPGAIRTAANLADMPPNTRYVEPDAVAHVIRYLCSPDASAVTGQVVEVAA